jgi:hypothetical protein
MHKWTIHTLTHTHTHTHTNTHTHMHTRTQHTHTNTHTHTIRISLCVDCQRCNHFITHTHTPHKHTHTVSKTSPREISSQGINSQQKHNRTDVTAHGVACWTNKAAHGRGDLDHKLLLCCCFSWHYFV